MLTSMSRTLAVAERLCMAGAQIVLFAMMATISIDAIGRYGFNHPLQGGYEVTSRYFMVILAFLGLPALQGAGRHLRIDAFQAFLDRIPFRLHDRLLSLMAGCAFALVAAITGEEALDKFLTLETTMGAIEFPLYLSYVWVPLGTGLVALRLFLQVARPAPVWSEPVQ